MTTKCTRRTANGELRPQPILDSPHRPMNHGIYLVSKILEPRQIMDTSNRCDNLNHIDMGKARVVITSRRRCSV
jgi:hypothetical protein